MADFDGLIAETITNALAVPWKLKHWIDIPYYEQLLFVTYHPKTANHFS